MLTVILLQVFSFCDKVVITGSNMMAGTLFPFKSLTHNITNECALFHFDDFLQKWKGINF